MPTDPPPAARNFRALCERLDRAGLLFDISTLPIAPAPSDEELDRARAAAGRATPLSRLIAEDRR